MEIQRSKWWDSLPEEEQQRIVRHYERIALDLAEKHFGIWECYRQERKNDGRPLSEEAERESREAFRGGLFLGIKVGLITGYVNTVEEKWRKSAATAQEVAAN